MQGRWGIMRSRWLHYEAWAHVNMGLEMRPRPIIKIMTKMKSKVQVSFPFELEDSLIWNGKLRMMENGPAHIKKEWVRLGPVLINPTRP